jgi:PAS domain S-box-containing protein
MNDILHLVPFSILVWGIIISGIINSILVFIILSRNSKSLINREHSLLISSFVVWAIGDILAKKAIGGWFLSYFIINIALVSLVTFFLRFTIVFTTGEKDFILNRKRYLLLYIPTIISFLVLISTDWFYFAPPVALNSWGYQWLTGKFFWAFLLFISTYCIAGLCLLIRFYFQTKDWNKKQQVRLFFIGSLITFIFGFSFDGLFKPWLSSSTSFTVLSGVFLTCMTTYAIFKYGFFDIKAKVAMEKIFKIIPDFLVTLDQNLNITLFNDKFINTLGYTKEDLENQPFVNLFSSADSLKLVTILKESSLDNYPIDLLTKDKKNVSVSLNTCPLKQDGNFLGLVAIAHDMRKNNQLLKEIEENKISLDAKNKELQEKYINTEKLNNLMIGRESKMVELKKENAILKEKIEKMEASNKNIKPDDESKNIVK